MWYSLQSYPKSAIHALSATGRRCISSLTQPLSSRQGQSQPETISRVLTHPSAMGWVPLQSVYLWKEQECCCNHSGLNILQDQESDFILIDQLLHAGAQNLHQVFLSPSLLLCCCTQISSQSVLSSLEYINLGQNWDKLSFFNELHILA